MNTYAKALLAAGWTCLLGTVMACQEERPAAFGASGFGGSSPNTGSGGSGNAGSGGTGGSGGAASGGSPSTGAGAGNSSSSAGLGGEGGAPANVAACQPDLAFGAVSGAFVDPTPRQLALRLNELIFDANPLAFVLQGEEPDSTLSVSYTVNEDGYQVFPGELVPPAAPAWINDNDFGALSAQDEGWLLVTVDDAPLELPLRNLRATLSTEAACTRGLATLTAVIPAEQADVWEELVEQTPQDAPDVDDRMGSDTTIRALFAVELIEFQDSGAAP